MSGGAKVVHLAGTDEYGVERTDQWGRRVVEYSTESPKPDVGELLGLLDDMKDEITGNIVELTEALGRLRRLRVNALDGDADAIANAIGIVNERSFVDEDHVWAVQCDAEALEEVVDEKLEERPLVTVAAAEIDDKVRELVMPYLADEKYHVTVTTHPTHGHGRDATVTGAQIRFDRAGYWINVGVFPQVTYPPRVPQPPVVIPEGSTLESVMKALTEAKGEAAAKSILNAVQVVAKDEAKQIELLWKAVGA